MKTQTKAWTVFISLIILGIIYIKYNVYLDDQRGDIITRKVSGMITDKYSTSYDCGSKHRDICYAYMMTISNNVNRVTEDTYIRYKEGDTIILTYEDRVSHSVREILFSIMNFFINLIFFAILFCICIFILVWLLFYSNTVSFKQYLRNTLK